MTPLINRTFRSPNSSVRPRPACIEAVVLHSSEGSKKSDINWLCSVDSGVSCHYYIDREGTVYELVDPSEQAWHAGISDYAGISDWNQISIGIELEHRAGQDYTDAQMQSLTELMRLLINRYHIDIDMIVAHRWIASPPARKADPSDWDDARLRDWIGSFYAVNDCTNRYRVMVAKANVRRLPSTASHIERVLSGAAVVRGIEVTGGYVGADRRWIYIEDAGFVHYSLLERINE